MSLTPTLSELENRLELNILTKSADYIDELKEENEKLVQQCRAKGIDVPDHLVYKGPGFQNSTPEEIEAQRRRELGLD